MAFLLIALRRAVYYGYIFTDKARLMLDSKGLEEHITFMGMGFIGWNEITRFELRQAVGTKILVIHLRNGDLRVGDQPWWKRSYLRRIHRYFKSPLVIAQASILFPIDELEIEMRNRWEAATQPSAVAS